MSLPLPSDQPYSVRLLKGARKAKGLSQGEMAALLGVHRTTVSAWEREITVPPLHVVEQIRALLEDAAVPQDVRTNYLAGLAALDADLRNGTLSQDAYDALMQSLWRVMSTLMAIREQH